MPRNLISRSGVPALAYPSTDSPTPWLCTLLNLLHSETDAQFMVLLEASISIHGDEDFADLSLRVWGDGITHPLLVLMSKGG
jgi:hypothetical protein